MENEKMSTRTQLKTPIGKLRLIQAFGNAGPFCDCLCMGRAIGLWADDEHTGFALSRKCAEVLECLAPYELLAEQLKGLKKGQSMKFDVPKWKHGSEEQWRQEIPFLLRDQFGVSVNLSYQVMADHKILALAI